MYTALIAFCILALSGSNAEERTIGGASGLTHLVNPGPQGPYPGAQGAYATAQPTYHSYVPTENQGFTVQSGYEGFVFPTGPAPEPHSALSVLGGAALGAGLLKHLLPFPLNAIAFVLSTKIGLWILGLLLLLLIGGATTTAVCAFTPLCTISFLGFRELNRESTRALFTQDRLNAATQFVYDAVAKFQKLQGRGGKAASKNKKTKESKEIKEDKNAKEDNLVQEEREVRTVKEHVESRELKTK